MNTYPKKELLKWANKYGVYPGKLAKDCGFSYAHAWELLKGDRKITYQSLGRLLCTYGAGGPAVAIAEAMQANNGCNSN